MSTVALAVRTGFPLLAVLSSVTLTIGGSVAALHRSIDRPADPPELAIYEDSGQLRVEWARAIAGVLEIRDGDASTPVDIGPPLASLTYARRSGDVSVRLMVRGRENTARFLSDEDAGARRLAEDLHTLALESRSLRQAAEKRLARIDQMQQIADRLLLLSAPAPVTPPVQRSNMTWWR